MKRLKVNLKPPYNIYIGKNAVLKLKGCIKKLQIGNYAVVITNKTIYSLHKRLVSSVFANTNKIKFKFYVLPDTERTKSFNFVLKIINKLGSLDFTKKVFFICWGGGVVGDLGGFIASIYKRGSKLIQIPTTLLAQIDSSIGGKVAIDLQTGKNLVGSFWQPRAVLSDVSFLKTLSQAQIREGLSEVIKYALIKDKDLLGFIEKNYPKLLNKDQNCLTQLIYRCAKIKKEIIEKDVREKKGLRTILNFGHTIGHGIEASSGYRISHGKAIALGIISAMEVSQREGFLKDKTIIRRVSNLMKNIGLPTKLAFNKARALEAIKKDKKFYRGKTRMVLLTSLGKVKVKENIPIFRISKAISSVRR